MLKRILLGLVAIIVVAVAVVLILATRQPDEFRVERSATINAPAEKIFAYINEFPQWTAWSPYEKLDPNMQRMYGGVTEGEGAVYEWDGSGKVGSGRMEITESAPPGNIVIKLDFSKPIEGHNIAEFTLDAKGDATDVTWAMHGPANFMVKVMSVFFDMDKMIGADFETGLTNLKKVSEQ